LDLATTCVNYQAEITKMCEDITFFLKNEEEPESADANPIIGHNLTIFLEVK